MKALGGQGAPHHSEYGRIVADGARRAMIRHHGKYRMTSGIVRVAEGLLCELSRASRKA
jgi:hypothetical protein